LRPAVNSAVAGGSRKSSGPDQPRFARELEHRLLQLLERVHFDLAGGFAADVTDVAQILEPLCNVGVAASGQEVAADFGRRVHRRVSSAARGRGTNGSFGEADDAVRGRKHRARRSGWQRLPRGPEVFD